MSDLNAISELKESPSPAGLSILILNDNFDKFSGHVIPSMISKFVEAKKKNLTEVQLLGTGKPVREFLHADDLANAMLFLLSIDNPPDWINVGTGTDQSILELANIVKAVVGYEGDITYDLSKPDGTPVKRLDVSLMDELGWKAEIGLREGIESIYQDFLKRTENGSLRD